MPFAQITIGKTVCDEDNSNYYNKTLNKSSLLLKIDLQIHKHTTTLNCKLFTKVIK